MKRTKPSVFVYILAYIAIMMRWMRRTTVGKVVTAGVLILLVSGTYNHLSAAPFFADNAQPKLTEAEKVEEKGKAEIAKKAEVQKQKVEEAKAAAQPAQSHTYSLVVTKSAYRISLLDNGTPIKNTIARWDALRDRRPRPGMQELRKALSKLNRSILLPTGFRMRTEKARTVPGSLRWIPAN